MTCVSLEHTQLKGGYKLIDIIDNNENRVGIKILITVMFSYCNLAIRRYCSCPYKEAERSSKYTYDEIMNRRLWNRLSRPSFMIRY